LGEGCTFKVFTRMAGGYSPRGTSLGSNPGIFEDFVSELEAGEPEEVHLALYLFNNPHLYRRLLGIASRGAKVTVTTIPLRGYDKRKIGLARQVYAQVLSDGVLDLRVFPHMYFWYGAEYAGGGASYSLHIKAGLVRQRDGSYRVVLASGNMAPGDPTHTETAASASAPAGSPVARAFCAFFAELEARSKPYPEYLEAAKGLTGGLAQAFDFSFVGGARVADFGPARGAGALFTAPFITYEGRGSSHCARELLVEAALSARGRLFLCAQHAHDIMPFDGYGGKTLLRAVIDAKRGSSAIDARVLKQVSSSGLADKRRAAFAEAHLYYAGVPQRVNKLVHDKFLVSDGLAVVGTGNFTATQFGWGARRMKCVVRDAPLVEVERAVSRAADLFGTPAGLVKATLTRPSKGQPKVQIIKEDVFSEVNCLVALTGTAADSLARHFESLWGHPCSSPVKIPF
jgi:hypothetical protein